MSWNIYQSELFWASSDGSKEASTGAEASPFIRYRVIHSHITSVMDIYIKSSFACFYLFLSILRFLWGNVTRLGYVTCLLRQKIDLNNTQNFLKFCPR